MTLRTWANREHADRHLALACECHETNGVLPWAGRGHFGWAGALAAGGEAAGAPEHAAGALDLSREHGYGAFEKRAAALVETSSAAGA